MTVVVDYGVGNLASVVNMGRKAGGEFVVSSDPAVIAAAGKLVLPGVGAFGRGMSNLHSRGLVGPLNQAVLERRVPILGLCLGMHLFTRGSEEGGGPGLGWLAADCRRFRCDTDGSGLKVPHMGWNQVDQAKPDPLLTHLPPAPKFYFVHSFHVGCDDAADVLLWATHGVRFAAGVRRGNIWGMQFHPEKSHKFGLALMRSFVELK
jgi:glutamine amidotransferase